MNQSIMDYLADAEGEHIHFNKTEQDVTSAYGIYRYAHPTAEIFKFYEELLEINGKSNDLRTAPNRRAIKLLMKTYPHLKEEERLLAWDFYANNFMNPTINDLVSDRIEKTFFSLSINGGMKRGYKALQYALDKLHTRLVIDGKFGMLSLRALREYLKRDNYNEDSLNSLMLEYMQSHYDYLVRVNPRKYARYENGWKNRLEALA